MTAPAITESFRTTMAQFPTAVTVIAAQTPDGPIGCTANAVLSLSLSPSSMLVSLSTGSRTLAGILAGGTFSINGLAWHQRELCAQFAHGNPLQRFDGVPHDMRSGAPVLPDSVLGIVCRVTRVIPVHDHTLIVGDVLWSRSAREPALVLHRGDRYAVG